MDPSRLIARQLGRPSRLTGRLLNLANAGINRRAVELLEVSPEHRALDVGFGGGVALAHLVAGGAFAAGIDHSEAAVRAARRRFRKEIAAGVVRVEEASVEEMPFGDASFDRALTVNTIYFWPDPEHALREICRVLAPGGHLVVGTDLRGTPEPIAKHGFTFYSEAEELGLLSAAGYTDLRLEREEPFLFALATRT